jgi:hypothetical protein
MREPDRAVRLYRRLLAVLPDALRREAEADLLEVFRDAHARVAAAAWPVRLRFWMRMIADLAVVSIAERKGVRPMRPFARLQGDIRLAARRASASPGWTAAAAGTLALGLAASIVTGVLVRDVLLAPLNFPQPERLVRILEVSENGRRWWPSFPNAAAAAAAVPARLAARVDPAAVLRQE